MKRMTIQVVVDKYLQFCFNKAYSHTFLAALHFAFINENTVSGKALLPGIERLKETS